MVTANPLAEFVGNLDPTTARALAAVEMACQAGLAAQPRDISDSMLGYCTWYRLAAVHDRDRLARAVDVLRGRAPRARLLDIAVAVMAYDAMWCDQCRYVGSEVYDLSLFMQFSRTFVTREVYDTYVSYVRLSFPLRRPRGGASDAVRELNAAFSARPVVRTTALFTAMFHAVAEQVMRDDITAVIQPGRDIAADMAVADHRSRGGGFAFDPEPGEWFSSVDDAVRAGAKQLFGVDVYDINADPGCSPNDVLTRHWSPVLLGRASELADAYGVWLR